MDNSKGKNDGGDPQLARLMSYASLDPSNASLLLDALTKATEVQQWEDVRTLLKLCDAITENNAPLCAISGYAYLCLGDYSKATQLLTEAIAQGVQDNDVTYNQAFSLLMQRRASEALVALESLDETYSTTPRAQILRARLLLLEERYDSAMSVLETVHSSGNVSAESAGLLALAAYEEGEDTDTVKRWLKLSLEHDPYNHEGLVAQAALLMDERDFVQARTALNSLVERYPKSGRGWIGIAQLEFGSLDIESALPAAAKAVEYNPEHIGSLHLLGWCHLMKGNIQQAQEAFLTSLELDRTFGETHAALASIYVLQDLKPKARKHLKLAERLNKDAFGVVLAQMLLLESEGEKAKANKLFETAKNKSHPALGGATPAQLVEQHLQSMIRAQN